LNAQHGPALQAAQAIDQQTITTLLLDPTNTHALQTAVQEIVTKLGISPADAQARLQEVATIPVQQLQLLQKSGPAVLKAQSQLAALGKVPASALATLKDAQDAANDSPEQWRNYFWIAVGGEVVFIPLIFLLAGFWSPRRAREAERAHDAMVERELARLHNS
jgi:ACS family D-galactonate transporter-like MFS transporter